MQPLTTTRPVTPQNTTTTQEAPMGIMILLGMLLGVPVELHGAF